MSKKILIGIIFCLFFKISFSSVGDTIKVQTFRFNYGTKPEWGYPRSGKFVIPDSLKNKTFSKILMRYALKCDPTQNPKCGEWDYITYTILKEKTGIMDSDLYTQPKFKVDYLVKDSISYINSPSYKYKKIIKKNTTFSSISSKDSASIGSGNLFDNNIFSSGANDGKSIFIVKAGEIQSSGFLGNNISSLAFYIQNLTSSLNVKGLKVEIKNTFDSIINLSSFNGLTEVYYNDYVLVNDVNSIIFNSNFVWDGVSNLLISISYESKDFGAVSIKNISSSDNISASSLNPNSFLNFGTITNAIVDNPVLDSITNQVTVMFWAYGDDILQPKSGSLFEGVNTQNKRYLNTHLPWADGVVYWDAGNSNGGYNRISKTVGANIYKGSWNHWALTKNSLTGVMNIYLNGMLWHTGNSKNFPMDSLNKIVIGTCSSCPEPSKTYSGSIDNFYIFHKELNFSEINEYIYRKLDSNLIKFDKLVFSFDLNEGLGGVINNSSKNSFENTIIDGFPSWNCYKGNRVNDFTLSNYRPNLQFTSINGIKSTDTIVSFEPIVQLPISIVRYDNLLSPANPTDTIYKWKPFYRYNLNQNGGFIDSVFVNSDTTIYLSYTNYYGSPYERINKWELGRFITPYGIGLDLGNDGWTWTYDVSDFVEKLKDTLDLEAGNFQELLDLQFWFIEGTPARNVLGIENIWNGDIRLQEFNTNVTEKKYIFNQDVKMVKLRTCVTGHGMESTNSSWAEFSPNIHSILVNGVSKWSWQIKQECATNPLYPQGGTWLLDRAGWCPGMSAKQREFELTPYLIGDSISIRYKIQYNQGGHYVTESQLVKYGNPNFINDIAIEKILVPSDDKLFSRENPSVGKPRIIIKNNGSTRLTSAIITYSFSEGPSYVYNWNGSLDFLEEDTVYLPQINWNDVINERGYFHVEVSMPNGVSDDYIYNNKAISSFVKPTLYSTNKIKLTYKTNHAPNQTKWIIEKANGEKIFESSNDLIANNQYIEEIQVPNGGYRLIVTDNNDDGLNFWYNKPPYGNGTAGRTQISFFDTINEYWGTDKILQGDFGKEIEYNFIVNSYVGLQMINSGINNDFMSVILYPNPTSSEVNIIVKGLDAMAQARVFDTQGREIDSFSLNPINGEARKTMNVNSYSKGIYYVRIQNANTISTQKLIIR